MVLNKIKAVVFDFDDTLAVHKDRDYVAHRKDDYFIKAYQNPEIFYDEIEPCEPNHDCKSVIGYCRLNGIPMYVLSGMRFTLHMEAKKAFINKHYCSNDDDIEFIAAASQERKDDVLDILTVINNCQKSEILFIDDLEDNIVRLKEKGYSAMNVNEVSEMMISDKYSLTDFLDD